MKNEITGMRFRLIVMNFLQFAVWGAYLTSMGTYLFNIGLGAKIGLFYAMQGIVYGCRVYGGCRVVWLCGW